MDRYNLIIIGGGPAGYTAADRAARAGLSVLLFEKEKLGGVCLNEGCIPTKTFLHSAKVAGYIKNAKDYGIAFGGEENTDIASVKHDTVLSRKARVVRRLGLGVAAVIKGAGASIVNADAHIVGKQGDLFIVLADGKEYGAEKLIVAAGSRAVLPPIAGLDESYRGGYLLTSKEILEIREVPKRLAIVGGGAVGLEFAEYFAAAGSAVTVIEMLPAIAAGSEPEVSQILQKAFVKKGVTLLTDTKVTAINQGAVICQRTGETLTVDGDKILFAVGRKPNTEGLGLENIGVNLERAAIITDKSARTNVKGVYGVGDINGKSMLAHTAYREAEVAINDILGINDEVNYSAVPSVIYTAPEVAWVGETEESAKTKGANIKVVTLPLTYSGRFVAENKDLDGIIKLIADRDTNTLVGAHIIGTYASEIIAQAAAFIDLAVPLTKIKQLIFPHPTVAEIIKEAVLAL
ncbi:MAG: dihydrolipoyl dehydrogenase [Clostridia bacterium]